MMRLTAVALAGLVLRAVGEWFDGLIRRYGVMLDWVLDRQRMTLWVAVATLGVAVLLYPLQVAARAPGDLASNLGGVVTMVCFARFLYLRGIFVNV